MKIFLDCMPCFLRQVLEASRMVTDNEEVQKKIMIEAARVITQVDKYSFSPEVAREIQGIIRKYTGEEDPYHNKKKSHIEAALRMYPYLKRFLYKQEDRLLWALKISAVGNIIDAAVNKDVNISLDILLEELKKDFRICDIDKFKNALEGARSVLIIGDNAGETVFDRVLVEELLYTDVVYAVRSKPILNDATVEDARESGLEGPARVIATGCDAPATIPGECSDEFLDAYQKADVVISKGQGNYETLSDEGRGIFFLLKAKCPVIANDIGVAAGDYVFFQR